MGGVIANTRGLVYSIMILGLASCAGNKEPVQEKAEYDTLAVVQTMLQDSMINHLLYNPDIERDYRDSLYIVKDVLSDSILSRLKLKKKKIAFLPPDKRPYSYMKSMDRQIMWLRILKIGTREASGDVAVNGYSIGREIEMSYESGEWKIKKVSQSHY